MAAAREAARRQALEDAGQDVAQGDIDVALPEVNIRPRAPAFAYPDYFQQAAAIPHPAAYLDQAHQVLRDQLERLREARNRDPNAAARPIPPALDALHARLAEAVLRQQNNAAVQQGVDLRAARHAPPAIGRRQGPAAVVRPGAAEHVVRLQRLREQVLAIHNEMRAAAEPQAIGRVADAGQGQGRVLRNAVQPVAPQALPQRNAQPARLRAPMPPPAVVGVAPAPPGRNRRPLQPEAEVQQPNRVVRFAPAIGVPPAAPQPRPALAPEELARLMARMDAVRQRVAAGRPGEAAGLDIQAIRRFAQAQAAGAVGGPLDRLAEAARRHQENGNQNPVSRL